MLSNEDDSTLDEGSSLLQLSQKKNARKTLKTFIKGDHKTPRTGFILPRAGILFHRSPTLKWTLGRELVKRHAPELERLTFEARLPGPHREVLWAPVLARVRGLERVYELWEEGKEPLEDAQHRTRLHERMGRQVFWVILEAPSHAAIERWLHREARPHYRAYLELEEDPL